jgi:hypothetical protein
MDYESLVWRGKGDHYEHISIVDRKTGTKEKPINFGSVGIPNHVARQLEWTDGMEVVYAYADDDTLILRAAEDGGTGGFKLKGKNLLRASVRAFHGINNEKIEHHVVEGQYLVLYLKSEDDADLDEIDPDDETLDGDEDSTEKD